MQTEQNELTHTKQNIGWFSCACLTVLFLALLCLFAVCLGGCAKEEPESKYKIYYISKDALGISSAGYNPENDDENTDSLIEEFTQQLLNPPDDDLVSPGNGLIADAKMHLEANILYVDFTQDYRNLDGVSEVLCRAAIVDTMTQIPGIDGIYFQVDEMGLLDADGNDVGVLTDDSFVNSDGKALCGSRTESFTLYFPNESGDAIVPVKEEVTYDANISRQHMIVERLLAGLDDIKEAEASGKSASGAATSGEISGQLALETPEGEKVVYDIANISGLRNALPEGTELIDIDVSGDTCYLNFNKQLQSLDSDMPEEAVIYSIVDSLTELPGITHVRIAIEGEQNIMLREHISLAAAFERNGDIIISGNE